MGKREWVEEQIRSNKVVVFSKSYCPYCVTTKKILHSAGLSDFLVFELDKMSDGNEIQNILQEITGARTVPRVFIGGQSIGGCSETESLQKSGQLVPKLKNAGAL